MGGSHSRSEDLRKRTFMSSDNYIGSLQEVPGYFTKTQETVDFLDEDLSTSPRIEMSYTGPPSHLRHSMDVHPFLDRFGPDFHPKERFVDLSKDADIPPSLLPSAQSTRELREIEVGETLATLKEQVKETLAKKRDRALEGVARLPEESFNSDIPTEEQTTLAFFDSIINESMGIDFGDDNDDEDEAKSESSSDTNWIMRDKTKVSLPGLMHSTVPVVSEIHPDATNRPNSRPASGFFRNSMYLPDTDPIHVASRSKRPPPPPIKPKPANRHSWIVSSSDGVALRNHPNHSKSPRPLSLPVQPSHSYKILEVEEPSESKNSSNSSNEDMGIVDDITSDEGSRHGDHLYDTKSRVKGVHALVSMYSEAATSPTKMREDFTDMSSSFINVQLPVRDYVFGNYNNSNVGSLSSRTRVGADKFQTYGTISSEDSALGVSSRDLAEDNVLGVIQAELQKLRVK